MLPVLRLPPGHLFLPVTAWAQPDKAKYIADYASR
jgi:hypothetical protein